MGPGVPCAMGIRRSINEALVIMRGLHNSNTAKLSAINEIYDNFQLKHNCDELQSTNSTNAEIPMPHNLAIKYFA
eukprot:scaffold40296_cov18-Prasinocladus_malaysianus.AAC.1